MRYLLIEFTKGLECQAYQELTDDGSEVARYLDLDGNELTLPEVTESRVLKPEYVVPEWSV